MPKKSAQLIDGKALAEEILLDLKNKVSQLDRKPGLAVILIGNDSASLVYVKNKKRAAEKTGIIFHDYLCDNEFYPNITEKEILDMIDFLNNDSTIDGIIIQLPIPKKFDTEKIIERIDPKKDVDGFHPKNKSIVSPLIQAVLKSLAATKENLAGKTALIVAKNPVFSEPLKKNLEQVGLKVKMVEPTDKNLERQTKTADVLLVILGQKHFIKKSMIKPEAIVIDIGTNLIDKNKWVGDVEAKAAEVASFLTPVPGGIGPLTVAYLLKNTFEAANKK